MHRWVVAGICVVVGCSAHAEPVSLGAGTLKQAIVGKTIHLDTPLGVAVPITYHGNGLMSGKAGVLGYFLGAEADRGRWWVANGKLCQKWFKWLDAQPSCMRLQQDGNRILWRRDDGLSGTATIAAALPPGADAPPRGLGGPVPTANPAQGPAPQPPESATRAAIDERQATPHAGELMQERKQAPSLEHGKAHSARALVMLRQQLAVAGADERWCYTNAPAAPSNSPPDLIPGLIPGLVPDVVPNLVPHLVIVARLQYAARDVPLPANACLAAEPALQHLAKLGIDAR